MKQPVQFDIIFPHGFHLYLATYAPRPSTYQTLCEDLWRLQILHMQTGTFEKPLHLETGCAFNKVTSEQSMSEWWWTVTVIEAGEKVHEMFALVYENYPPEAPEGSGS